MKKNVLNTAQSINIAKENGLRYMHPDKLTIHRLKNGKGFRYIDGTGNKITDKLVLSGLQALKIPPAYTAVCISPFANGHLQAVGKDERGRTQYLYHPEWRIVRDANKFHRMLDFGKTLPHIRQKVQKDLKAKGYPREKILAALVAILDKTAIRIGNEEYAEANKSFGLTTLHNRHAVIQGATIQFSFRGKRGIQHSVELEDKRLAKIIRACQDLPGYELFEYRDETGAIHHIESADVNDYLKKISHDDFTAKDFRTWHATVLALDHLLNCSPTPIKSDLKNNIKNAIKQAAEHLGNTPAICKKSYIYPQVLTRYAEGSLADFINKSKKNSFTKLRLRTAEKITLTFLTNTKS